MAGWFKAWAERRRDDAWGGLQLGEDVGDVGLVEGRERKAFLAEVVEGCTYVNEGRLVDDEKAVVEFVGGLDRERVGVLRVELRHIDSMKQLVPRILHREHRYALPFLCDEWQNAVGEVRVDDAMRTNFFICSNASYICPS